MPSDAHPGGRYIAVYFESITSTLKEEGVGKKAGADISSRISSLIYIKVNGPISEKAIISRFFTPNFYEYGPLKIETQILNRGDYHIRPRGIITMSNIFGAPVGHTNLKEENIFPDVVRNYENSLGKKYLMIGKYKLAITASYGEKGQILEAFTYVWIFPWRMALAIILTIILLVIIIKNNIK